MDVIERFEMKFKRSDGCWLWTAALSNRGYGNFSVKGTTIYAHRFSYETYVGPIPDDMCILHRCDVKRCVNPEHLFVGTILDNIRDMDAKGRRVIPDRSGAHNGRSKITEEDVRHIRNSPLSGAILGKQYGVHQVTIDRIKTRVLWSHI